jgi:hypothetical protein
LDDYRQKPDDYDVHVKTAPDAIAALEKRTVTEISLDYDLGDYRDDLAFTGRAVAAWIARNARDGTLPRIKCHVHSDNLRGRKIMLWILGEAERFWTEQEMNNVG